MEPRDPFDLCGVTIDGKYRVASVVGDGGFGVVYRGVHKGFGELIAIKCLKLPTSLEEEARAELLEKLQEEGRLLHRLSKATSGIVQALDVGAFITPGGIWVPYLVMEWLEGETLGEFLKRRADEDVAGMALDEAIRLLEPAARALAVAHAQKIAHRDVKPANIFLSDVGGRKTAKLLDFGIAKVLSGHLGYTTALENTAMAATAFTPRYGAPEQFNKQRGATGPWTDVFALALVTVECASGHKALQGDDPTQLYIASADPALRPTLRARGVEVPDEVEEVLRKALEVEPKNRYPDAGAFWSALEVAADIQGADTFPQAATATRSSRPERPVSRPDRGSRPSSPKVELIDSGQPMLETGEYAARRQLRVDAPGDSADAKSAFGPTVPHESLRQVRKNKDSTSSRRAADPMEETPEGARADTKPSAGQPADDSSKGGYVWTVLALAVFIGGGAFVYSTLTSTAQPKPLSTTSASSTASSTIQSAQVPRPPVSASARASASLSAITSVPSASASTSADPVSAERDDMVRIDGATFMAGDPGAETTVDGFWIDRLEVTVRRYKACMNAKACTSADTVLGADPGEADTWNGRCNARRGEMDHPMNCVTFGQAEAFCKWDGKRLPRESEWELAARGPKGNKYVWGDTEPSCDTAWYDRNGGCMNPATEVATAGVGVIGDDRNDQAAYDLTGNVAEWVVSGGPERATKGGHFLADGSKLAAALRETRPSGYAHPTVGFRCVEGLK